MAKEQKKSKRKVKDLQTDVGTGANVKGGQASVVAGGPVPSRKSIYRKLNETFRPKS